MSEGLTFTQLQERNASLVTANVSLMRRVSELEEQMSQRDAQIAEMDNRIRKQNRHVCELFDDAQSLRAQLEQRDAQIAALAKQEPAGYAVKRIDNGSFGSWLKPKSLAKGNDDYEVVPLFERAAPPAPVVVQDQIPAGLSGKIISLITFNVRDAELAQKIWAACVSEIKAANGSVADE